MNLSTVSKAIAGAIVTAITAYATSKGVLISPELNDALILVIAAVVGFVGVYIAPKNKP